jgi:pre-mRNA-splicing factor SYF2
VSANDNDEEVALESFSDDDDAANATTTSSASTTSTAQQRLFNARLRLNEARKRNHQQVLDEAKRSRTDADAAARERRRQWHAKQAELSADAEARGLSAERAKLLHTTAFVAERSGAAKKARRSANDDNDDDDDAAHFEWDLFNENTHARHHQKLVAAHLAKSGAPAATDAATDAANTAAAEIDAAAALDPTLNPALLRSSAPRTLALNKLVDVLHAGAEKRAQFSRRRTEHEEADVDYINAKNKTFNKKLAKAYDAYSADIRQSLERGSAI